jgi:asparagine synthase (glutamine-hydrolysing)
MHRGPDGEGYYFDDSHGVGLGHRRLTIIDLTTGDQPMQNEDGTVWIVYNGELYNYVELRDDLSKLGHRFASKSDTEVIIHAYEEYGQDCTKKFNGIFAFAIWDKNKNNLFLARDHFGVKPLYYYIDDECLIFGSEIKSLLSCKKIVRELDTESLALCLTYRYVPPPKTFLRNVLKLAAAHSLCVESSGEIVERSFWDRTIVIDHSTSESEWIHILRGQFQKAVKRQMIADVPIGISLSGGVDSTAILALMTQLEGRGVHAFTVRFEGGKEDEDETACARKNAEWFGAKHYDYTITSQDYSKFFEKYLWHLEEPIGNESAIAYYFVAEMAKGIVKVLLNGQGADELFAGYDRYLGVYYSRKMPFIPPALVRILSHLPFSLRRKNQLRRLSELLQQDDIWSQIESVSSIISSQEIRNIFSGDLYHQFLNIGHDHLITKEISQYSSGSLLDRLIFHDMFGSLSENLLLCEDKMAMAASIEVRVPFLDIEFATTALSIPSSMKIRRLSGKYIHKKMCETYLPTSVVYQNKIGFDNPVDNWLKNSLGDQLMDYVHSSNSISGAHLNVQYIETMYNEHKKGAIDNQRFLFLLLSIEKWAELFLAKE